MAHLALALLDCIEAAQVDEKLLTREDLDRPWTKGAIRVQALERRYMF